MARAKMITLVNINLLKQPSNCSNTNTTLNKSGVRQLPDPGEDEYGENLHDLGILDHLDRVTAGSAAQSMTMGMAQSSMDEVVKEDPAFDGRLASAAVKDTPPMLLTSVHADHAVEKPKASDSTWSSGVGSLSIQASKDVGGASGNDRNSTGTQVSDRYISIRGDYEGERANNRPTPGNRDKPSVALELDKKNQTEPNGACMSVAREVADEEEIPDEKAISARIEAHILEEKVDKLYIEGKVWEVIEELGEGMTATCYLVVDVDSGKHFCLKVPKDPEAKFVETEISRLQELWGISRVIKLYGWLEYETKTCVLLQHLPEIMAGRAEKTFNERDGICMLKQVLECINKMDEHGIAHCDIKENNIGIEDGIGIKFVLFDFGQSQTRNEMTEERFHEELFLDVQAAVSMFDRMTEKSTNNLVEELLKDVREPVSPDLRLTAKKVLHYINNNFQV